VVRTRVRSSSAHPDPRPNQPALGAPKDAPSVRGEPAAPWSPLAPLSDTWSGGRNLLEVIAGYFIPTGGGSTHMMLLVELALLGAAVTVTLFRAPLLRLVQQNGRQRAGYRAVALRPG
jgi:hypothetical protein